MLAELPDQLVEYMQERGIKPGDKRDKVVEKDSIDEDEEERKAID